MSVDVGLPAELDEATRLLILALAAEQQAGTAEDAGPATWRSVAEMFARVTACSPRHAEAWLHQGMAYERCRAWPEAVTSYAHFARLRPSAVEGHLRLGLAKQKAKDKRGSRRSYEAALRLDPEAPAFLGDMLAMESRDYFYRQWMAKFVAAELPRAQERAAALRAAPGQQLDRPVFTFWAQGAAAAPPVVKACLSQARRVLGPDRLHVLDTQNWPFYVTLPPHATDLQHRDPTHFSDVLRMALLTRYAGTWIDATCLLRPGASAEMDRLADADFFAFRYVGPRISNWYLATRPAGYVVSVLTALLLGYWERYVDVHGYFMFHDMFEALYWADEQVRHAWDTGPDLSSVPPHDLQHAMYGHGDEAALDALVQACFVHKLTYKFPRGVVVRPDSLLATLVRRSETAWV